MADVIAGRNPVTEALRSGRPLNKVLLDSAGASQPRQALLASAARGRGIPVEYVTRQALDRLAGGGGHQGVIALAAVKDYVSLDDLLAISREKGEAALYVLLDGIEDPQNLGAILRTADAAGVHGAILRARRAAGLTEAVARASAGAIEYVPVARVANLSQGIRELKEHGLWVTGIDMSGEVEYDKVDYSPPTVIVIGGEGGGISPLVRRHCDTVARIPMTGKISSLNASVAAALAMYEAFSQRRLATPAEAAHVESHKGLTP